MATVVDDTSGMFGYFGSTWSEDHAGDASMGDYFNSTFHSSTKNGDYCIIAWRGTDIIVYGARRANHGIYGVQVDGGAMQSYSGFSDAAQFQQVLFQTSNLQEGQHEIKLSNENAKNTGQYPDYVWFDIDHAAFTGTLLNANPNANPTTSSTQAAATSKAAPTTPTTTPMTSTQASSTVTSESATTTSSQASESMLETTTASADSSLESVIDLTSLAQYSSPTSSISIVRTITGDPTSSTLRAETRTTGTPAVNPSSTNASEHATSDEDSSSNKTTVVAVSVTVIVIAAVVIATIVGLWWWRRKRRAREEDEDQHEYLAPQAAWR